MRAHRPLVVTATTLAALAGAAAPSLAGNDNPVILQWFEAKWTDIERRTPDFFLAGYGAVWLPPPSKAAASNSAGYDVFDRFDLGKPSSQTAYGTEAYFRAVVSELHQANGLIYIDAILNHCSTRQTSASFQSQGGYPGFWMAPATPPVNKQPTDNWGDFHAGTSGGYYQSENPSGARYDLYNGDLVALIDIAQESNHQFIRQPVASGNPLNIPAGSIYNKPDAGNARFYPDQSLSPLAVNNPGTFRNPGANNFSFHPFNATTPLAGDAVTDNTTGLLMRWTQWLMDEHHVDGFRFDAIKHVPSWFWDTYIDSTLSMRRVKPSGARVTPYTFGESVESNSFTYTNFIRKPNNNSSQSWRAGDSFGNRDALDINGSGSLRDLVGQNGFGSWLTPLNNHIDNADGFNDGTLGVNHTYSHDNGTAGNGSSAPPDPTLRQQGLFANAYVLMRTGTANLYHNARGISRSGGFWPRQGINIALGVDPASNASLPYITTLVQLHNWVGRGEFNVINSTDTVNPSLDDVIVFERRTNTGSGYSGNCLVGCNDRYDAGYQERNVATSFPVGTRLIEYTGNAADATVDPSGQINEVLTVGAGQRVTIRVPNNKSTAAEHNRGYVVYAPAIPSGTLAITPTSSTLPADSAATSSFRRRNAAIPVVSDNTFSIQLATTNGDPGAGNNNNADDNALFRIDQGFRDYNANGITDIGDDNAVIPGYEQFLTLNQPLAGTNNTSGQYAQTVNTAALSEGYHYISVIAFRKRNANEAALYREFRSVIYVDRTGPAMTLVPPASITTNAALFYASANDRTATKVHLIANLPTNADPVAAATSINIANREDRFSWYRTLSGLFHGLNRITIVAFEESGNVSATDNFVFVDLCPADVNNDGFINGDDYDAFASAFDNADQAADFNTDGFVNGDDYDAFASSFESGC
jgi:hypothetical protein